MLLNVYTPKNAEKHGILDASAIVGSYTSGMLLCLDYEGNKYGSTSLASYAQRLLIAAGRHEEKYPTIARIYVLASDFLLVGEYETTTSTLSITDTERFEAWSGETLASPTSRLVEARITREDAIRLARTGRLHTQHSTPSSP